ncbi:MAG: UvrD-helicase domain-containing protein [Gammaproteobacteria bacterium]|nr:UvrD-helicase domain-containing protein [Gammaproteobacteria bacterium]
MSDLNPPQRAAIRYHDGPLLVLAGAGSGKTRVIATKIAHLIESGHTAADRIAAITFTNKAAKEMKSRVQPLLKKKGGDKGPWISTFHTLGLRILREEYALLGYRARFTVFDTRDCEAALADIARRESGTHKLELGAMLGRISAFKNAMLTPELAKLEANDPIAKLAAACYADYCATLKAYNALDFDDLITLPVRLFTEHQEALERWQDRIRYLLVDEYQDTNSSQYELVKLITSIRGKLTVVGDDDQSIYAWRGARPENLAKLTEDFPNLKVIKLEQNYRSLGVILKAANRIIGNNPHVFEKKLWSDRGFGEKIKVIAAGDEFSEADQIAARIAHHRLIKGTRCKDYAILFRSNHQARLFESALREHQIPYVLSGSRSFFDAAEIKDTVCYMRLLVNPDDDNAFLRIVNSPRRGIGAATVEQLVKAAAATKSSLLGAAETAAFQAGASARAAKTVGEFAAWLGRLQRHVEDEAPEALVRQLLADISYHDWIDQTSETPEAAERRKNNLEELLSWVKRLHEQGEGRNLAEIVTALTLFDVMERQESEDAGDNLALMTLHAAKGLEFPHVYLVGLEENILPHRNSIEADTIEEERRLAYVGITRARETLTLSFARTRRRYGETLACEPSRFLAELPQEDLAFEGQGHNTEPDRQLGRATLSSLKHLLGS